MGVVQRQGIKDSLVTYLGVALGAFNVLFIYTAFLSREELGLFQYLVNNAMILSPIVLLGASNLVVRYFPLFRDDEGHHGGLLPLMLLLPTLGFLLAALAGWIAWPQIQIWLADKDPELLQYLPWLAPLTLLMAYGQLLANYLRNFLRIVIPSLLDSVMIKICTALLSVGLYYGYFGLTGFVVGLLTAYGLVVIGQLIYIARIGQLRLRPDWHQLRQRPLVSEMAVYGLFGILGSLGGTMMVWLDKAIMPYLIDNEGLAALGIYTIVAYIGTVIDVPKRSLEKITSPLIVDAFERDDLAEVHNLYRKTALNQLIAGMLFFLGIWLSIDDLLAIIPNGEVYAPAKNVVLLLGLNALFDMVTGNNSQIITYSRYFRFNFYILLVLAVLNIGFNVLFVREMGLYVQGAALATLCAVSLFNIAKLWFIYRKWRMHPFQRSMLSLLALGGVIYGLEYLLFPGDWPPFVAIAVRSVCIGIAFLAGVYLLRISPDLQQLIDDRIGRSRPNL